MSIFCGWISILVKVFTWEIGLWMFHSKKRFWRNHALIYRVHQHSLSIFCGWISILVSQVSFSCENLDCEISHSKKFLTESCPDLRRASTFYEYFLWLNYHSGEKFRVRNWAVKFVILKSAFDKIKLWFTAHINILWVFSATESAFWWARWAFNVRNWAMKFLILKAFDEIMPWFTARINILWVCSAAKSAFWWSFLR